uniref:Uncharacterized protein n=1 Tax=Wuchereria bancrofti TaxID=6293 RepID=A0AAF5PJ14_WUCBA
MSIIKKERPLFHIIKCASFFFFFCQISLN